MENIILISTSDINITEKRKITYGQEYTAYFQKFFPKEFKSEQIKEGIIFFKYSAKKENPEPNSIQINIQKLKITSKYIYIEFDFHKSTEFSSSLIKEILRTYLRNEFNISSNEITPYFTIVEKTKFLNLLKNEKLLTQIKIFERDSQWENLAKLFEPFDKIEEIEIWSNPQILNKLGFALSRLSECSINLKKQFPDPEKRKNFLNQKQYYRVNCEKIYDRLIELDPHNPSYYSSKAYFHYQNLNELILPGGRRDGNFFEEVQKAIDNLENAIELDFNRINDHYRKGYILGIILPQIISFSYSKNKIPDKFKDRKLLITEGTHSFERVINIYENQNLPDDFKKPYFNTYLKTLYNLASIYQNNLSCKTEKLTKIINLLFPSIKSVSENEIIGFDHKIRNHKKALEYLEKFIRWVNKKFIPPEEEADVIKVIEYEDSLKTTKFISPRLQSYQLGKIYFELFLLTNDINNLKIAKKFFLNSLRLKKTNPKEKDFYIQNLLAQTLIFEGKADMAIKLLEDLNQKNRLDQYINITLIYAYLSCKEFKKAENQIDNLIRNGNPIYRKELLFCKAILLELQNMRDDLILKELGITKKEHSKSFPDQDKIGKNNIYQLRKSADLYSQLIFKVLTANE
ncbi:MAG: hypothetical protein HPY57_09095 [Ignavibacteria bacterium]|nr:hypothetical protein [Ignavibacteria bacterium]